MNKGYSVFSREVDNNKTTNLKISVEEYNQWCKDYSFDALKNIRYGQSFCNKFDLTDYVLFYMVDYNRAHEHIQNFYIK